MHRYAGIDDSGTETPNASLKALRVCEADRESLPVQVAPPPSPRKYWTRCGWKPDRTLCASGYARGMT